MAFKSLRVQHAVQSCAHTSAYKPVLSTHGSSLQEPFSVRPKLNLIQVTLTTLQYLNVLCIVYRIWPVLFLAEKIDDTKIFNTRLQPAVQSFEHVGSKNESLCSACGALRCNVYLDCVFAESWLGKEKSYVNTQPSIALDRGKPRAPPCLFCLTSKLILKVFSKDFEVTSLSEILPVNPLFRYPVKWKKPAFLWLGCFSSSSCQVQKQGYIIQSEYTPACETAV